MWKTVKGMTFQRDFTGAQVLTFHYFCEQVW